VKPSVRFLLGASLLLCAACSGRSHADPDVLFGITKIGMRPPYVPSSYESDVPAFGGALSDRQIWDVLAYVKSRWSPRMREAQSVIDKQYGK
jgi:mono/diheme cytochrome c family protein